jgi:hypothetical protein
MKYFIALFSLIVLLSCAEDPQPAEVDVEEAVISPQPPQSSQVSKTGMFVSFEHSLAGNCSLYTDLNNNRVIRLENFTMTMGPDVYVLVSKSNNYSKANVLTIAKLSESYNATALNIALDSAINLDEYKFVLVYCVQFHSLFGYTELK